MANQHRPARVTDYLQIPVPGDDELADYVTGWGQVADATDAKVKAAASGISDAVANAGTASLPYALLLAGC